MGSPRILENVLQTLLRHPVNHLLRSRPEPVATSRNPQPHHRGMRLPEARHKLPQRRRQAQPLQDRRAQRRHDAPQLGYHALGRGAGFGQPRAERVGRVPFHSFQLQPQQQQGLSGLVVQFAPDPAPFLLLRAPALQRVPAAFGRGVEQRQLARQPRISAAKPELQQCRIAHGIPPPGVGALRRVLRPCELFGERPVEQPHACLARAECLRQHLREAPQ